MKKNIIANIVGRFWGLLSNFLFIPLYIKFLGFESYSIISFTLLIAGVMAILDGGLTATLSREFARNDNSIQEKQKVYKTLESSFFIIIVTAIFLVFFSSDFIAEKWLTLKSFSPAQISLFLKVVSFDIGFQLLLRFYMGGLLGLEKQVTANMYQVGWGVLRNGLVVFAIMFYPSLNVFFVWQSVASVLFAILLKLHLDKILHENLSSSFKFDIDKIVFSRVGNFAGGMLLIAVIAAINTQMDKIVISKMLSVESLGYYTLAISLSQGLIVVVNPIATAVLPKFTSFYSSNKNKDASTLYSKYAVIVAVIVFSFLANIVFFSKSLVWVWTNNLDIATSIEVLVPIVAFAYAMVAMQVLPYHVAIANGYTKLNNLLGVISIFITIPGYLFAVKEYQSVGAASVFCGVQILTTIIYLFFINRRFLKLHLVTVYIKQIVVPLTVAFSCAFLFSKVTTVNFENRIFNLTIIGFCTCLTLAITALISIQRSEVKNIFNITKK